MPVSLAFVSLAAAWLLLPWDPQVPRYRLLGVPAFVCASFLVVYLTGGWFSAGLFSIAVANAVFLFGFRLALGYAVLLLTTVFLFYTLEDPGLGLVRALEIGAHLVPSFVFVIGVCTLTQRVMMRQERAQQLLRELEAAHDELRSYAEQVRELSVSEERNRMAREIHDTLGHYLTVINVQIEAAGKLLERDPERAGVALTQAKNLASEALSEVRRSVQALKPLAMEERGGTKALTALVEEFGETGPEIFFEVVGDEQRLAPETELVLYRTLQEGLTNSLKHSGAGRIETKLFFEESSVRLTVADDGRGAPHSLFALPAVLPQSTQRRQAKIDYLSAITIASSVVALLLSLSWVGEGYTWGADRVVAGFIVSAVFLVAFIAVELRGFPRRRAGRGADLRGRAGVTFRSHPRRLRLYIGRGDWGHRRRLADKNIRLEEQPVEAPERGYPADGAAITSALAGALQEGARTPEDDQLAVLLMHDSVDDAVDLGEESAALLSVAERIEHGNGDYPGLIRVAAKLANGHEGSERERALHVSKTIIRPLAESLAASSGNSGAETTNTGS